MGSPRAVRVAAATQPLLQLVDPGKELAGEHRARVVDAEISSKPRCLRQQPRVLVAEHRRRPRTPAGLDQPEPDQPPDELGVHPRLAGERLDPDQAGYARGEPGARAVHGSHQRPRRGSNFDTDARPSKYSRSFLVSRLGTWI